MFNFLKFFTKKSETKMDNDLLKQIATYKTTPKYLNMLNGVNYYQGKHDILNKKRTVIGAGGVLQEVANLVNNKIVDNQYKKAVLQKVNYLVGKPLTFRTDNKFYEKTLKKIFDKKFNKNLKELTTNVLNCGVGWLYVGYDIDGIFFIKNISPLEILPEYDEVGNLIKVIRFNKKNIEIYDKNGVEYYEIVNNKLKFIKKEPYIALDNDEYAWNDLPFICFKYNIDEIPLINNVKSLQDALNTVLSNFQNNLEEDVRSSVMVLINYEGANLAEFRQNLATYGVIPIRNYGDNPGDVKLLQLEVNVENYKYIIEVLKKAIIENTMSFDAKSDRLNGTPNQLNIISMYSDIDLDANAMETEFQASFEKLLYYVNSHLYNQDFGDFTEESVDIIFNRDILINESEAIDNIIKSSNILSRETLIAQHPWVDDVNLELNRLNNSDFTFNDEA